MARADQTAKDVMDVGTDRLIRWAAGIRSAIRMANNCGREGPRQRIQSPSTPQLVQEFAPPKPSRRSEGISATAGALNNLFPRALSPNHQQIGKSRRMRRIYAGRQQGIIRSAAAFRPKMVPYHITASPSWAVARSGHFPICSNFEQSLLKLMTSQKTWSSVTTSGWPEG